MSLRILKAGILTTLQDTGRIHYRHLGINPGGAMDTYAARLVNILVGNPDRGGVLEFHFPAGSLVFEQDAWMVIGGADFQATLNDYPINRWRPYLVKAGTVLSFPKWHSGRCAYLAVQGGFDTPSWLGSLSTNLQAATGGFQGRKLKTGDQLLLHTPYTKPWSTSLTLPFLPMSWYLPESVSVTYSQTNRLRILAGAEWDVLLPAAQHQLVHSPFTVGLENNRMGYQLESKPLATKNTTERISSAVSTGTLQLLPNGQLTVLMADAQTTGGYPHIGSVISVDLPALAQKISHETIYFHLISLQEAETLLLQQEQGLQQLVYAVRQKRDSLPHF